VAYHNAADCDQTGIFGYTGSIIMTNPLDKATSHAPPTVGEGCLSRYDVDAMSPEDGTDFEGAQALWEELTSTKPDDESDRLDSQ
jgi:hypothetical protein